MAGYTKGVLFSLFLAILLTPLVVGATTDSYEFESYYEEAELYCVVTEEGEMFEFDYKEGAEERQAELEDSGIESDITNKSCQEVRESEQIEEESQSCSETQAVCSENDYTYQSECAAQEEGVEYTMGSCENNSQGTKSKSNNYYKVIVKETDGYTEVAEGSGIVEEVKVKLANPINKKVVVESDEGGLTGNQDLLFKNKTQNNFRGKGRLTFDSTNWDQFKTLKVKALDDVGVESYERVIVDTSVSIKYLPSPKKGAPYKRIKVGVEDNDRKGDITCDYPWIENKSVYCGMDGKKYNNECELMKSGTAIDHTNSCLKQNKNKTKVCVKMLSGSYKQFDSKKEMRDKINTVNTVSVYEKSCSKVNTSTQKSQADNTSSESCSETQAVCSEYGYTYQSECVAQSEGVEYTMGACGNEIKSTSSAKLKLSLSSNNPPSRVVSMGSSDVKYLSLKAEALGSSIILSELQLDRFGLGNRKNFDKVWLKINGNKVTNKKSISKSDKVKFNLSYKISSNSSAEINLFADLAKRNNMTHQKDGFRLASINDVKVANPNASIIASVPLLGNKMTYSKSTTNQRGPICVKLVGGKYRQFSDHLEKNKKIDSANIVTSYDRACKPSEIGKPHCVIIPGKNNIQAKSKQRAQSYQTDFPSATIKEGKCSQVSNSQSTSTPSSKTTSSSKMPKMIVKETDGYTELSEGGATDKIKIKPTFKPLQILTGFIGLITPPEIKPRTNGSFGSSAVYFDPQQNWNQFKTINLSAVDDSRVEGYEKIKRDVFLTTMMTNYNLPVRTTTIEIGIEDNDFKGSNTSTQTKKRTQPFQEKTKKQCGYQPNKMKPAQRVYGVKPDKTVKMKNTSFLSPAAIKQGEVVEFVNKDNTKHTVTINKLGIDIEVAGKDSVKIRVNKPGKFKVVCTIHPGMETKLNVKKRSCPGKNNQNKGPQTDKQRKTTGPSCQALDQKLENMVEQKDKVKRLIKQSSQQQRKKVLGKVLEKFKKKAKKLKSQFNNKCQAGQENYPIYQDKESKSQQSRGANQNKGNQQAAQSSDTEEQSPYSDAFDFGEEAEQDNDTKEQIKQDFCPLEIGKFYTSPNDSTVFKIVKLKDQKKCVKRPVQNGIVFSSHFKLGVDKVSKLFETKVTEAKLKQLNLIPNAAAGFIPWGEYANFKNGSLVTTPQTSKVYLIMGANKYSFNTEEDFCEFYGECKWGSIRDVNQAFLDRYETKGSLPLEAEGEYYPAGMFIKQIKDNGEVGSTVYKLEKSGLDQKSLRPIASFEAFQQLDYYEPGIAKTKREYPIVKPEITAAEGIN